ncbi:hypothetical protein [Mycoplasma sp. E35C]|uniref:hypothetical protein n=1 Tax=Mycoplasma sp. E35C TaxID=2801918 RepID=UPI001CA38C92|nr:hypothetical protein [Mycoplasma sp. E35C]QZX48818.1 hypothetical protein JJE79_02035 [Mycoplasma sp. E35C]
MRYRLTDHSKVRAKQRLILKEKDDIFIESEINDMLEKIIPYHIDDKNFGYFEFPKEYLIDKKKRLFAVIQLDDGMIVSITPISPRKFLNIYNN